MRTIAMSLLAGAHLAAAAKDEIRIVFPATAATDTGEVKKLSGVSVYQSKGSKVSATLPGDSTLKLAWDIAPAAGDGDYAATGGALIPLTTDGRLFDISSADSVYFDVKAPAATNINVILSSRSLPKAVRDANASVQLLSHYSEPGVIVGTSWKTIGLATEDFKVSFFCNEDKPECLDASTDVNWKTAGKEVDAIDIQPILVWKNAAAIQKNASGTVYVRNFRITGVGQYIKPPRFVCKGSKFYQLDDFAGKNPNRARLGGYWLAFTDASSAKPADDMATGASSIVLPEGTKAWKASAIGALLTATLEKNVGTDYHKYAGWATVGVRFPTEADADGIEFGIDLPNLRAISFDFTTGVNIDPSLKFDDKLVPAVNFKVAKAGIGEAATHFVTVPASAGDGASVCVDIDMLRQPSFVKERVDFIPKGINQLSWEMKIEDQKDPILHTSGPNSLLIGNVKLWGFDSSGLLPSVVPLEPGLSVKSGAIRADFKVAYGNGLTVSYKLSGPASVSVVRLDGSVVASFRTAAVASNLNLPVSLTCGTYMVVVRGDKAGALVRRIAVSR